MRNSWPGWHRPIPMSLGCYKTLSAKMALPNPETEPSFTWTQFIHPLRTARPVPPIAQGVPLWSVGQRNSPGAARSLAGLWRALQKASDHLRRIPRHIRGYASAHAAGEKRRAIGLFLRRRARQGIELFIGSHAGRHGRAADLLSAAIARR